MISEEMVREDLNELRYYYQRRYLIDKYIEEHNLPSSIVDLEKLYADAIRKAPIIFYHAYVGLYVKGWTQDDVAAEMGFNIKYVQALNIKLIKFLQENISKEEVECS